MLNNPHNNAYFFFFTTEMFLGATFVKKPVNQTPSVSNILLFNQS